MAEFQLIDLSHHNSVADFLAVKNAGIYGVILRAGYGREASQKDRKFDEFYAAAKAAGLYIGAYWYSRQRGRRRSGSCCLPGLHSGQAI